MILKPIIIVFIEFFQGFPQVFDVGKMCFYRRYKTSYLRIMYALTSTFVNRYIPRCPRFSNQIEMTL